VGDKVTVTVNSQGTPNCVPDVLTIGKSMGSVVVKWTMATPGYEITGVTKIGGDPLDPSVFSKSKAKNKGGWQITDKNEHKDDYAYVITVKSTATGKECAYDPLIRNGGRGHN
jgi:hypothetical protein